MLWEDGVLSDLGEAYALCCIDSEDLAEEVLHLFRAVLHTFLSCVYHCLLIAEILGELAEFIVFGIEGPIGIDFYDNVFVYRRDRIDWAYWRRVLQRPTYQLKIHSYLIMSHLALPYRSMETWTAQSRERFHSHSWPSCWIQSRLSWKSTSLGHYLDRAIILDEYVLRFDIPMQIPFFMQDL